MHLEPVEIQHIKLQRSLLGYDREAVDRLLEDVVASYEDVWYEREKLDAELASLRNRLDGQEQAKQALEGSVRTAQQAADDLLAEARSRAQKLVDDAHQRGLATVRDARSEHQRLHISVRKLEVAETEITLRLRALLTAARELLDGHEGIRRLAETAAAAGVTERTVPNGTGTNGGPAPHDAGHAAANVVDRAAQAAEPTLATAEPTQASAQPPEATEPAAEPTREATPTPEPAVPQPAPAPAPQAPTQQTPTQEAQTQQAPKVVAARAVAAPTPRPAAAPSPVPASAPASPPSGAREMPASRDETLTSHLNRVVAAVAERPRTRPTTPDAPAAPGAEADVDPSSSDLVAERREPDPAVVTRASL